MDFQKLDIVETETILNEVQFLFGLEGHVLLQKGDQFIFDLPYTNSLLEKYSISTARIMKLYPKQCYSWHHDTSPRIHLPLVTNEKCLFILEDSVYQMPAGNAYYVNTTKKHTALNGNRNNFIRYHIVGLVSNELV